MAGSDLGKYLKTLAIIIAFAEYILNFWHLEMKTVFKAWYIIWEKFFNEKHVVATIYLYMGRTFEIGL